MPSIDVSMFDTMAPELIRFYEQAELRLAKLIGQASSTPYARRRADLILQQINSIVAALEQQQQGWSDKYLPRAYRTGMEFTNAAWQMPVLPPMTLLNRQAIATTVARTMADTSEALESVAPFARRVWIDTQQALIREQQIARFVGEGIVEGLGPQELGRRIRTTLSDAASSRLRGFVPDALREQLERTARGEFISITCRDGVVRNYNMKSYGELIARTATRQAATEGAIARTLELGGDLVTISVHNGSCPICLPYQGKTYSITGRTPGFPLLTGKARPPIHPNCRHLMIGESADIMGEEGVLDPMREVSASDVPVRNVQDWSERLGTATTSVGVA